MAEWDVFAPLKIPTEYQSSDPPASVRAWKLGVEPALNVINQLLAQKQATGKNVDDPTLACVVFHASPYALGSQGDGLDLAPWTTPVAQRIASDILSIPQISQPTVSLVRQVLLGNLKPVFSSNPHPYLNTSTGRKLTRPAGGLTGAQDYYDEQTWKTFPGIWSVLAWAAKNIPREAYEGLWPLFVPPMMTLLDDYKAKHKLEGVRVVSCMLPAIPRELLRRTGVDELIFTSLQTGLSHLSDPETPTLLSLTISTWLNLTLKVDDPQSFDFFDRLCTLVVNGIIEGIWIYSEDNFVTMKATLDALPDVFGVLGTATIGFLKSVVLQVAHILAMRSDLPIQPENLNDIIELQKSAGRVLLVVMEVGSARMEGWKFTILDCVARCWVRLVDAGPPGMDSELRSILCEIMLKLTTICPDISQNIYKTLLMEDHAMFDDLVGVVPPVE